MPKKPRAKTDFSSLELVRVFDGFLMFVALYFLVAFGLKVKETRRSVRLRDAIPPPKTP